MFLVPAPYVTTRSILRNRSLDRLFDDAFGRLMAAPAEEARVRVPALDVAETEAAYTAQIDLPGVAKEDVQVSIEGRRVSVQASARQADDGKTDGDRLVYRERAEAHFARSFVLPKAVDAAQAQAKLDNGVLTLTLPKAGPDVARITVN